MMHSNKSFIYLLFIILIFSSCEKVIDLKLNPSDSRLVIEAQMTNELGSCSVKLSRVINYDQANNYPKISNAIVRIEDNGVSYLLTETAAGIYTKPDLQGVPGHTYNLKVIVDGEEYTSSCKMPTMVQIDTVYTQYEVFFVDTNLATYITYQDPSGERNYYRYILSIADTVSEGFLLDNDTFYDGQNAEQSLFSFNSEYMSGDSIKVELWSIDAAVYKYFSTLSSIIGGQSGQLAAPANPSSNISGGAMGYFNVYGVSRGNTIVP
jgi:hypothetical protein